MAVTVASHTMKLTVDRATLLKAVQQLGNVVNERSTLPILSHVLLSASHNTLTCAGTDLDMGMTVQLAVELHEEGSIAVPARRFMEMIKELPEGPVHFQARKNQSLLIESQKCLFRLVGLPADEFPQLPPFPETGAITCDQSVFKFMLNLTNFAMSTEEARYVLNGALLNLQQHILTIVATDGRRLALATTALPATQQQEFRAIIPSKTIRELLRIVENGPMDISLLAGNQMLFRFHNLTLISRLMEGEFPNYEKVIPPPAKDKLTVNRVDLQAAVRRASLLTSTNSEGVRFDIAPEKLLIFKEAADIGEVREEVAIAYAGKPLTLHFNPHYLLDVLKVLPQEELTFELATPAHGGDPKEVDSASRRGVIRSSDYLCLIMPMQPPS